MKTGILKLVCSLILVMSCTALSAQQKLIDKVVAVVGDRMILLSDIQQQKLQMIQNRIPVDDKSDCFILEELIFQKLLLHQADIDSVVVSDEQVEAELNNRITYYKRLLEQYGKTIEQEYGMSESQIKDEFRVNVKERLLSENVQNGIAADVAVTPKDIRKFYEQIPADSLPRINMQVEYSHIVIFPEVTKEAEEEVLAKLREAKEGVESGKHKFSFYATLYSEDPGSRNNGGDFTCVSRGMFVPEFDAVAFSMEPGTISEPFKTEYGWHILYLRERRGDSYCGAHILITPKIGEAQLLDTRNRLDSIAKAIKEGKLTWDAAARKFSMDEETKVNGGKVYNNQAGSFRWDVADLERDAAMSLDQLEANQVSPIVSFQGSANKIGYRIIMLDKRHRPHVANLTDDYPLFQRAALEDKKDQATQRWFTEKAIGTYIWITPEYDSCSFIFRQTEK
jgi:peptidyl-prolyl cis-trans isomerase SurA